jgi:MFS family permease
MAAFQIQAVAVGWQVYSLTGRALDLGLVGLAQFLPMITLFLLVGHVADRYDRKRVVAICQTISCLCSLMLMIGSLQGWLDRDMILAVLVVAGGARAFENPTLSALLPTLVPPSSLQRAIAFSASSNQTASVLGPALGGLLYALGGAVPYGVAFACFLTASLLVRTLVPLRAPEPRPKATLRSLFSGLAFIWQREVILGSISLDLFAVLLGGATALLPIYARDILHTGSWGMGLLRAAPAIGALAMSMLLAGRPPRRRIGRTMFVAVSIYGLATLVFALSSSLALSMAALFIAGAADVISVVIRVSLVQLRTPEAMMGRVTAVNALFVGTSAQLGEFESGVTAALFGAVGSVLLGGLGTILVCLAWMKLFPALRDADQLSD